MSETPAPASPPKSTRPKIDWEARFHAALVIIARGYQTSEQLKRGSHGLDGEETLEYAYDNIQGEARAALHGYRAKRKR